MTFADYTEAEEACPRLQVPTALGKKHQLLQQLHSMTTHLARCHRQ